jgi:DeoR/GlpR family transcriptional regulator of sugar metabolism
VLEAQLNCLMMDISKEVNVVADFSKLGRRSVSRIGLLSRVHRLITDTRAPAEFSEALRKSRIEVITA